MYFTLHPPLSRHRPRPDAESQVPRNPYACAISADIVLAVITLIFGTPIIQAVSTVREKWGPSTGVLVYAQLDEYDLQSYTGVADGGWLWLALSVPVYLVMFDFVFYFLHLVLHVE